ncbi:MAG: DegV family protein [Clostridia bacterium]|nr:DegV family protein [Clostridia bacterium]
MNKIQVYTDTASDNLEALINEGVKIVPLYISFDGVNSLKQNVEISLPEFYERMRAPHDKHPKTSLASIQDYYDLFEEDLKDGKDVLYICMNGKMSSTLGAANNAKAMLEEDYPNSKVCVVDSTTVTYGMYHLAKIANDMAKENKSIEEIANKLDEVKPTIKYFFTVETLDYLRDGGRIGGATALLGGVLNIKPVMLIEDGEIKPISKVRGRNKSLESIKEELKKELEGKDINDYELVVLEGDIVEEANEFKNELVKELNVSDIPVCKLGISIGLHAGPGTMGLGIMHK